MATGYTDDYGNYDYTKAWEAAINSGASYAELAKIAAGRAAKTQQSQYAQYANDATQQMMNAYLKSMAPTSAPSGNPVNYSSFYQNNGYQQAANDMMAAYNAYMSSFDSDAALNRQRVNQSADKAAQEAYIAYMQSKKTLPQQLAAAGYNGGLADSQRLALDTNLQNAQAAGQQQRLTTLQDIDAALAAAKAQTSLEAAKSQSDIMSQAMAAYNSYVQQQEALANENYWRGIDLTDTRDQTAYNQGMDAQAQAQALAMQAIQTGQMPSAQILAAAGMTQEYAQMMAAYYAQQVGYANQEAELALQQAQKNLTASGSGSGSTANKPNLTYAQMMSALDAGYQTPEVLAAYQYYLGTPYTGTAQGQAGQTGSAHADPSGLMQYVQVMMGQQGMSVEQVVNALLAKGYSVEAIDNALALAGL